MENAKGETVTLFKASDYEHRNVVRYLIEKEKKKKKKKKNKKKKKKKKAGLYKVNK